MAHGLFITLEGPEGGGKSTQARRLAEWLRSLGRRVVLTREPGGDPLAEGVRALLQNPDLALAPRAEVLLFLAARAQHVDHVILPALREGAVVVCDRFSDSTIAYQCYGAGQPLESVCALNHFATGGLEPDLTLVLDVDVRLGLQRQGEWTRMELRGEEFHQRVRAGFLRVAEAHPQRIRVGGAPGGAGGGGRDSAGVMAPAHPPAPSPTVSHGPAVTENGPYGVRGVRRVGSLSPTVSHAGRDRERPLRMPDRAPRAGRDRERPLRTNGDVRDK